MISFDSLSFFVYGDGFLFSVLDITVIQLRGNDT